MEKRVFVLAFAIVIFLYIISFASSVEISRFENIYFKLCADSFCDDNRIAFSPEEGRMYIRAYNFNGAELSGEITKPDGEEGALEFSHLFSQDDYTIIYFSGEGTYRGNVKAVKDGYLDFEKEFTFYVGEKSEIIDLSEILCSDVPNAKIAGSNALSLLGNFNSVRDSVPVAEFYQNVKDEISTNNWNLWTCPPANLERGQRCYPAVESKNLLSYAPLGDINSNCFGSISGEYKSGRVNRKILPTEKTLEDSMAGLAFRLQSESGALKCGQGCYKKTSLDVSNSEVIDAFLTRTEVIVYNYKIECVSVEDSNNWKLSGEVDETKMCLNEIELLEFETLECENYCPASGARICSGEGFRVCGDFDNNGCLEWGEETACSSGEECDLGQCYLPRDDGDGGGICSDNCNIIGVQRCQVENIFGDPGIMVEECTLSNGCKRWTLESSCSSGDICEQFSSTDARCVSTAACEDECAAEGIKQCYVEERPKYRACGNYDGDRCLEWSSGQECAVGEICFEGQCRIGELDNCIDSDGDGYGVGAGCTVQDCDDGDSSVWELIGMCHDWDGDGYGIKQSYGRPLLSPQCGGIMPLGIIAGKIICPADDANLDCNDDDSSIHTGCGSCPVCDRCNTLFGASVTGSSAVSLSEVNGCGFMNGVFSLNKQPAYELSNTCFWGGVDTRGTSGLVYCENGYWKWNEIATNFNVANKLIDVTSLRAVRAEEICAPVGQFILQGMCAKDLGYGGNLQVTT